MLPLLFGVLSLVHVVDASSGRLLPHVPVVVSSAAGDPSRSMVEAQGSTRGYTDFHGTFPAGALPLVVRVSLLSVDERRALARVNLFRARLGLAPLVADENLTEAARYWAREERLGGRVGHTCVELGRPRACVEFNVFFHRLPGAPPDWFAGQNAAFDTLSSWLGPEQGFEDEASSSGNRGHYENLIEAARWIGFGETRVDGYGSYFAMNLI